MSPGGVRLTKRVLQLCLGLQQRHSQALAPHFNALLDVTWHALESSGSGGGDNSKEVGKEGESWGGSRMPDLLEALCLDVVASACSNDDDDSSSSSNGGGGAKQRTSVLARVAKHCKSVLLPRLMLAPADKALWADDADEYVIP